MTDAPPYSLIRSRRKTIALHITKDATVEVRAPLKASKADIDRFVIAKLDWIERHISAMERRLESKAAFALEYGVCAYLAGQAYPILARAGNLAGFDGERFYLPPGLPPDGIKHAIIQTYSPLAKQLLAAKTDEFAKLMSVKPSAVKVNGAKTRWGSCSGKNSLNFSWRLIIADESVSGCCYMRLIVRKNAITAVSVYWSIQSITRNKNAPCKCPKRRYMTYTKCRGRFYR